MLLSEGIYLWKLSMNAKSLFCWAYGLCYISSVFKRLHSKERIASSSFFDQELRFAITNYSLLHASLYVILFYLLQVYLYLIIKYTRVPWFGSSILLKRVGSLMLTGLGRLCIKASPHVNGQRNPKQSRTRPMLSAIKPYQCWAWVMFDLSNS
jgi:hypothetical protein